MRGATTWTLRRSWWTVFQSTPPMRGATFGSGNYDSIFRISIHAPHAGGDDQAAADASTTGISIHAPHAGGDGTVSFLSPRRLLFQSTPPRRGATGAGQRQDYGPGNFNPRPPCGGRRPTSRSGSCPLLFQSTPPMRGATADISKRVVSTIISIHAPHAGGDSKSAQISLSLLFKAENISRFVLL